MGSTVPPRPPKRLLPEPASLTDSDKAWIAEMIGQAVSCLAYAHSAKLGEAAAQNLDGMPENNRLGVRFKLDATYG